AHGTDILFESFIDGAEVSVDLLVQDGQIRFHSVTDNFPKKEPFFVDSGEAMPSRHEDDDLRAVHRMAEKAITALGLTHGALHLESIITEDGPKLLEVNARMGENYIADWAKTVWDVDLVDEALKIAIGLPCLPQAAKEPKKHLVSRFLAPASSGIVSGISGPDATD